MNYPSHTGLASAQLPGGLQVNSIWFCAFLNFCPMLSEILWYSWSSTVLEQLSSEHVHLAVFQSSVPCFHRLYGILRAVLEQLSTCISMLRLRITFFVVNLQNFAHIFCSVNLKVTPNSSLKRIYLHPLYETVLPQSKLSSSLWNEFKQKIRTIQYTISVARRNKKYYPHLTNKLQRVHRKEAVLYCGRIWCLSRNLFLSSKFSWKPSKFPLCEFSLNKRLWSVE